MSMASLPCNARPRCTYIILMIRLQQMVGSICACKRQNDERRQAVALLVVKARPALHACKHTGVADSPWAVQEPNVAAMQNHVRTPVSTNIELSSLTLSLSSIMP